MTFKSMDLQMSVPRTQEFSGMHGQAIHKPVADQNMLAAQTTKDTELARGKNSAVEQTNGLNVRSEKDGRQEDANQQGRRKRSEIGAAESEQEHPPTHPFKGHRLDIKL
ncbi:MULTISPECIES: hypothetical protein [Bacillales]|uniref:hypothetical protein n=1 Tax=Bacillales TaxID=1385 RepID=UPI0006A7ED88|nr:MULTISPECIES: hypothetical protein [Bacillales]OBZ16905.1 hypothetical protein A7975_03105 [Bacillus sp. FJAT-26390]